MWWGRFKKYVLLVAVSLDQSWGVIIFGFVWWWIGGEEPDPDETISSRIGRAAMRGRWWGRSAEIAINALFHVIAGQENHCRKMADGDGLKRRAALAP